MAFPFKSVFKRNEKLNKCAVNDPDHISERDSPVGPHVLFIKQALNAWSAKQKPPFPPLANDEFFDAATGTRVELYKANHDPPIINFAGKIDRIVGKKTVKFLDDELPPDVVPDVPVPIKTFVDFVIRFRAGSNRAALDGIDLTEYRKKANRSLVDILEKGFMDDNLVNDAARKIEDNLIGAQLGIICIYGNSAGGRNVINLARVLKDKRPIKFLGIADAMLFGNLPGMNKPKGRGRFTLDKPQWTMPFQIDAEIKHNFFQDVDNKVGGINPLVWTSDNPNHEIHGKLTGFINEEIHITLNTRLAGQQHDFAGDRGDERNQRTITGLLANL